MIRHLMTCGCMALGLMLGSWAQAALSPTVIALHWHPQSLVQARELTLAAAIWLDETETADADWKQAVQARTLAIGRARELVSWQWGSLADGSFGWLVQMRELNLVTSATAIPHPQLSRAGEVMRMPAGSGRLARLSWLAAYEAPAVWRQVADRLTENELDANREIEAVWQPLLDAYKDDPERSGAADEHAADQARRIRSLQPLEGNSARSMALSEILLAQAGREWSAGQFLAATWLVFEGLARLAQAEQPRTMAVRYANWLEAIDDDATRQIRRIDVDLPVVMALLEDAARHLAAEEPAINRAHGELADAYARLALFVPDMGFYLDQPVRQVLRDAVVACNPDPLLVGPLPRETYERCLADLGGLLESGLASEELVGGPQGPFAPEFLRRELGLVSWQRAAYLDGHLGWMLNSRCESPPWFNVLDWALVAEHLARWVPTRPVFFATSRWQDSVAAIRERMEDHARAQVDWIDCLTGQGSVRQDPVLRLVRRHELAVQEVQSLLREAEEQFYRGVVRTGADIDLDGPPDQLTAYRPEGLTVGPCPGADSCGARVELPVSRALLGLFPNAYLLADQIDLGDLGLCYDQVRWVDRTVSPAREQDQRVANYQGRLSFDLVGSFSRDNEPEIVFRHRLIAAEPRHYLFAANQPEILQLECPRALIGESVASELPPDRPGLVPDRLTYFTSAPTTPEAQMVANWDRGAEWRDWFITGDRTEQLEMADAEALKMLVQAQLAALSARRERQLASRLVNPVRAEERDPLALAMARVTDATAMIKRVLELHYPRVVRHHDPVRALVAGEAGLVTRDRVRGLRDTGVSVLQVPQVGLERIEALRAEWLALPAALRESGQLPPEADVGMERIDELARLSRFPQGVAAPPVGQ